MASAKPARRRRTKKPKPIPFARLFGYAETGADAITGAATTLPIESTKPWEAPYEDQMRLLGAQFAWWGRCLGWYEVIAARLNVLATVRPLVQQAQAAIDAGDWMKADRELRDLRGDLLAAVAAPHIHGGKAMPDAPSVAVRIRPWCQRLVTRHTPKQISQQMLWQALERSEATHDSLIALALKGRREACAKIEGWHERYHVHLHECHEPRAHSVGVSLRTFQNEVAMLSAAARRTRRNPA